MLERDRRIVINQRRHALCLYPYREDLKRGRFHPPLGLEIIARMLSPHYRETQVIDLRYESQVGTDFVRPETDLVCLSANWDRDKAFLREQVGSIPSEKFTILGGRHATEAPEEWLNEFPNIDILVRGDGEETVEEICKGVPLEKIAGISYRHNGNIVHTPNREYSAISDDAYPDRSLRRYRYSVDLEGVDSGLTIDSVSGSRGCPFKCRFCSFNLNPWGEKRPYSARSPESVVEELAQVDAKIVAFTDDVFTHDMDRVSKLCDLIIEKGIKKRYIVNSRIELSKRMDVVRKMEKAGFAGLLLGVESSQDKTLRAMQKGFNTDRIREHFKTLRKTRMILHGYFILGCLGETREEMLQVAPFARELGIDTLGLSPLRSVPFDGLKELVEKTPGYRISSEGFVYSDEISREQLREIRRAIKKEFYTARRLAGLTWKGLCGGLLSPFEMARLLLAGLRGDLARRRRKQERRDGRKTKVVAAPPVEDTP